MDDWFLLQNWQNTIYFIILSTKEACFFFIENNHFVPTVEEISTIINPISAGGGL